MYWENHVHQNVTASSHGKERSVSSHKRRHRMVPASRLPVRRWKGRSIRIGLGIAGVYLGMTLFIAFHFESILDNVIRLERHDVLYHQTSELLQGKGIAIMKANADVDEPLVRRPAIELHKDNAELALLQYGAERLRLPITAFLEPPMRDILPASRNQGDKNNQSDPGQPPEFIIPLPRRTQSPKDLRSKVYPTFQTCHDLPAKLPVDRGLVLDRYGTVIRWNTRDKPIRRFKEINFTPVEDDPFLPWIHDMIPSNDGTHIQFVSQNKRRCNTGSAFQDLVWTMQPQVALFQHVSVKRVNKNHVKRMAPDLWQSISPASATTDAATESFYQLVPMEDADKDGQETRFICRFHITSVAPNTLGQPIFAGETLSVYPFNYELVSYRRLHPSMLNPRGTDNGSPYLSTLLFNCPVPASLQELVASGDSVLSDGTPMLHLDVIPIRTSPRYGTNEIYLSEDMIGPQSRWHLGNVTRVLWRNKDDWIPGFDPRTRWGDNHFLPAVEASGRWTNLPICQPTHVQSPTKMVRTVKKPHELVACVWTSASYSTRSSVHEPMDDSVVHRLKEWLAFTLLVGFDHIYVYDNSAANTPNASLASVLKPFGDKVTRIEWPHVVCNNNNPGADNCGERSSQYAAESSCRTRFGRETDWIATIDVDEYLIPMGNYTSLKDVVRDAYSKGDKIVSFRSSRSKLLLDQSDPVGLGRRKRKDALFLEAYNCDSQQSPKPYTSDRARKEIYRADHVLYHFVHYSLVTKDTIVKYKDYEKNWQREVQELAPPAHVTDEVNEAVMLHAKGGKEETHHWRKLCKGPGCLIGFPRPFWFSDERKTTDESFLYNCYPNQRLNNYWLPKLKEAMAKQRDART